MPPSQTLGFAGSPGRRLPCSCLLQPLFSMCLCSPCPNFPPLTWTSVILTLTQCDLIFNLIASAKTLFLNKSHSHDLGLGPEHILPGNTTPSITGS